MKVDIDSVRIPDYYLPPNRAKYSAKYNSYMLGNTIDPVIVDDHMNLVDGYISYLIFKEAGAQVIDVYYENELPIVYITGNHPHSSKEYIWYVPLKLKRKFSKKVNIGDTVRCRANNKVVPVIVRNIYIRNEKDGDRQPVVGF